VVGLIEKPEHVTTQWFKDEGDAIILLGEPVDQNDPLLGLGGSAYLQAIHGRKTGSPPRCDLEAAKTLHATLLGLIQSGLVKSAHDCSDGGLAVALAESCISQLVARETPRLIGATVDLSFVAAPRESAANQPGETSAQAAQSTAQASQPAVQTDQSAALSRDPATVAGRTAMRLDALLFGETQSRVVVSCKPLDAAKVAHRARLMGVAALRLGTVGGDHLTVRTAGGEFSAPVAGLHDAWWNAIARAMA
jgi:phosphoribosylformylglycinamidine synthase